MKLRPAADHGQRPRGAPVRAARSWSTASADVDTAALLVSEVVTNAILHARTDVTLTVERRG